MPHQQLHDTPPARSNAPIGGPDLRATIDHAPIGIAHIGRDGRWLLANPHLCALVGYSQDELAQLRLQDLLHPDERAAALLYVEQLLSGQAAPHAREQRWTRRGGDVLWVSLTMSPLRTPGGEPDYLIAIVEDISARKRGLGEQDRLLTDLHMARGFLATVVQQMPEGVAIAVAPSGQLLMHNREAVRLLGHPFLETSDYSSYTQYGGLHADGSPYQAEEYPLARALLRGAVISQEELIYRRGDGTLTTFSVNAAPVWGADGQIIAAVIIFHDISRQKQISAALRESEERFGRAFCASPLAMAISAVGDGRILDVNERFLQLFGHDRAAVIGQTSRALDLWVNPLDREVALSALQREGAVRDLEVAIRTAQGGERQVLLSIDRLHLSGVACILTSIYDITERKRLEEQLVQAQKMESIGQLTSGIAHDFNNLLTAIVGYTELSLAELPAGMALRADLREIQRAVDRARRLTRQLLSFARHRPLDPQIIDLNELIGELDRLLRRLISEDIAFVMAAEPQLAPVRVDPSQIEQVLFNLVINARDAMPDGGTLTIATANVELPADLADGHPQLPPGQYVMFSVSDTGTGMPPEVLARLFEPFFTTKDLSRGTGLGLAICDGIVRQHGGMIRIASQVGCGTVAEVYLPRAIDPVAPTPPLAIPAALPRGSETVLLVEDEAHVRGLAARVLRACGYTVLEAADGVEALHIARAHAPAPIHLLLADVVMPRLDGPATAARIVELYPAIKVLLITGYSGRTLHITGALERAAELLQKPFTPSVLARRVRELLDSLYDARSISPSL